MSDTEAPAPLDPESTEAWPIPAFEQDPETKPPLMISGDTYVAQSEIGEFRWPLSIPRKTVRAMAEDSTTFGQLEILLRSRGTESDVERLDNVDDVTAKIIARGFFDAYTQREVLRLGEYQRSSRS